jgi:hypothetical protein
VFYSEGQSRRGSSVSIAVELDGAVPAHAVALVGYGSEGARAFGLAAAGAQSILIFSTGRCVELPRGTRGWGASDDIELAWLADSGILSKKTKLKVRKR